MITVGDKAPEFKLKGVLNNKISTFSLKNEKRDRWLILFFYPADFSFICPTELKSFKKHFTELSNTDLYAISVDDLETHQKWVEELDGLPFPLLTDEDGKVAKKFGALGPDGRAQRATYIIDKECLVHFVCIVTANVGRGVEETIRVLKALQTGEMCPADWRPEMPTLKTKTDG